MLMEESKLIIIYTIGFSKKNLKQFILRLKEAGVKKIIDVRLNNTSQLAGYAKKDDLEYVLSLVGIDYEHHPYIFMGRSDRLSEYEARSMKKPQSLALIKIIDICLEKRWTVTGSIPRLRAKFLHNLQSYDLAVTDVLLEEKFKTENVDVGEYNYKGKFLLTISLGESFMGAHYKLVTSVLSLER